MTEDEATCSGAPEELGLAATVQLGFGADALRGVTLAFALDQDPTDWTHQFLEIEGILKGKYGPPQKTEVQKPPPCQGDTVQCLRDGRASRVSLWSWGSAYIKLQLGRSTNDEASPLLFAEYYTPSAKSPPRANKGAF